MTSVPVKKGLDFNLQKVNYFQVTQYLSCIDADADAAAAAAAAAAADGDDDKHHHHEEKRERK